MSDSPSGARAMGSQLGDADAATVAESILHSAEFDFRAIEPAGGWMVTRELRAGLSLRMARTSDLPPEAIDAILGWRLGQYVLTGFYDAGDIQRRGLRSEPADTVHDDDLHALVVDSGGALITYITLKRPEGHERCFWAHAERPLFPCEQVHGRAWQRLITQPDGVDLGHCWEVARFVSDRRRPLGPATFRGALELALTMLRLATDPDYALHVELICGDLDPQVALRNARYFFIPVATFPAHTLDLGDHPLAPRYRDHATAPFLVDATDLEPPTWIRWADIDVALSHPDLEAMRRLAALRRFVNLRESRLKRPRPLDVDRSFPDQALLSPSSLGAATALWEASRDGAIAWEARLLGAGEILPLDRVVWVVDGYLRALIATESGMEHLAAMGPEVAYVPDDDEAGGPIARLEAVTPARALIADRAAFEAFWRARQRLFDTSTEELYGLNLDAGSSPS